MNFYNDRNQKNICLGLGEGSLQQRNMEEPSGETQTLTNIINSACGTTRGTAQGKQKVTTLSFLKTPKTSLTTANFYTHIIIFRNLKILFNCSSPIVLVVPFPDTS